MGMGDKRFWKKKKKEKEKEKREEISSYHEKNMSWIQWKHDIDVFYQR